ncbi:hypothetical protein RRF57_012686 [Xylaria bambusicola]|uniref:DUF8035 domain-containing protein n=1 Tax=Xylaria bambusicola TaxID=326684 RepID=A0AAN7V4F9_9PEZI
MATYHLEDEAISASPAILASIDTLDAFARKLYRRARNAGSSFEAVATVVRDLHTVLKHLKVEAEDPESLLNSETSAIYTRQLAPIIEDAEFALKQLDTILERYFDGSSSGSSVSGEGERHIIVNDSDKGWTMLDNLELDRVDLIRSKLASQKLSIDMFLDTVQLHNPSKSRQLVDTTSTDLEAIKDKVDAIASRLCQRKNSGFGENEDQLWEQFRDALEEEGFSKEVLRKNQDVLRAYIRQVDEQITASGGGAPSVRGLLENYTPPTDPDTVPPYPAHPASTSSSEGGPHSPDINNEKCFSMKIDRLQYDDYPPQPTQLTSRDTGLSYDHQSSDDQNGSPPGSLALISTHELMALDRQNNDLTMAMGNMHIQNVPPSTYGNYVASSSRPQKYLPPSSSQPLLLSPSDRTFTLDEPYDYEHDPPPRYVPSLPPPPLGVDRSSPPTVNANSVSAPSLVGKDATISSQESKNRRSVRLGPDSQGREIPPDAKWTRIRRSLVSPEVLAREGLRYEARPEFVAVLGELKREDVADLARKTADVRNARRRVMVDASSGPMPGNHDRRRRPDDAYHPDKYRNWDVIEARRDRNGPGYIIDPHRRYRANSTVSSTGDIWDSSDDEASEDVYGHPQMGHVPSSYPPPSQAHPPSYYHQFNHRNGSSGVAASADADEKGTKVYPIIVPSPVEKEKNGEVREKTSPSATVKPKPILKNKNDDPHVRFDPEPQVFDDYGSSLSQSAGRRDRGKESNERNYRDRDRDKFRMRERDRERRYRPDRDVDRERRSDRDGDRDREREHRGGSSKYYTSTSGGRRGDRDDRRYRDDRDRDRDRDRGNRKKSRNETLRAVGIGGAAASLLSVLTEAAAGL